MQQLTFNLPVRAALDRADFFESSANAAALAMVLDWRSWLQDKLVLIGPAGSGKTHLAHVWAAEADAHIHQANALVADEVPDLVASSARLVVEDVDLIAGSTVAEQALFHLHNLALADGGSVLMTGVLPPAKWPLELPDLKSRVLACNLARLEAPDDTLLSAVLVKLFSDRQIEVAPHVIQFLAPRMERSLDVASRLVAALDAAALAEKRSITIPLARPVLDKFRKGYA